MVYVTFFLFGVGSFRLIKSIINRFLIPRHTTIYYAAVNICRKNYLMGRFKTRLVVHVNKFKLWLRLLIKALGISWRSTLLYICQIGKHGTKQYLENLIKSVPYKSSEIILTMVYSIDY